MVHPRELVKIKKELEDSDEQKDFFLKGCEGAKEISFPQDSLSSQNPLSSLSLSQKAYELSQDTQLSLEGDLALHLEIVEDMNLVLFLDSKERTRAKLSIKVKEGKNLKLSYLQKGSGTHTSFDVFLEESAKLSSEAFLFGKGSFFLRSQLEKDASSELKLSVFTSQELLIQCTQEHLGVSSFSDLKTFSFAQQGGRIVCDGKVHIRQDAHESQGYQKLKGMLLDDRSSISTEPILEVDTNDVRCSHAASVSKLKFDQLFYLQSRGLSEEEILQLILSSVFSSENEEVEKELRKLLNS
jgi:Fe-S cluster assembly scaffold protein SufB